MDSKQLAENVRRLREHSESLTPDDKMRTIEALVQLVGEMNSNFEYIAEANKYEPCGFAIVRAKDMVMKAKPIAALAKDEK